MKISASIELIWQLADAETIAGEFPESQPGGPSASGC
jgi:hypothetical protein